MAGWRAASPRRRRFLPLTVASLFLVASTRGATGQGAAPDRLPEASLRGAHPPATPPAVMDRLPDRMLRSAFATPTASPPAPTIVPPFVKVGLRNDRSTGVASPIVYVGLTSDGTSFSLGEGGGLIDRTGEKTTMAPNSCCCCATPQRGGNWPSCGRTVRSRPLGRWIIRPGRNSNPRWRSISPVVLSRWSKWIGESRR